MWWNYQEGSSCVKLVYHRHDRINIQFDIIHFVLLIIIICSKPVLHQRRFVLIVSSPNCNACVMLQPLNLQKYWDPFNIGIYFLTFKVTTIPKSTGVVYYLMFCFRFNTFQTLFVGWVHTACKHKILPYQDPQFICDVIKVVRLINPS